MSCCPSTQELISFLASDLSPDEDAAISSHFESCLLCQEAAERQVAGLGIPKPADVRAVTDWKSSPDIEPDALFRQRLAEVDPDVLDGGVTRIKRKPPRKPRPEPIMKIGRYEVRALVAGEADDEELRSQPDSDQEIGFRSLSAASRVVVLPAHDDDDDSDEKHATIGNESLQAAVAHSRHGTAGVALAVIGIAAAVLVAIMIPDRASNDVSPSRGSDASPAVEALNDLHEQKPLTPEKSSGVPQKQPASETIRAS